jgi:hypothetical protein
MVTTYTLIDKSILTSTQTSITLNSIPNTFTDLKLVASTRDSDSSSNNGLFTITLNGSTTYSLSRNLSGNGSSPNSGTGDLFVGGGDSNGNTANTYSNTEVYFPNYLSSNQKSISADAVSEQNGTTAYMALTGQLFNLTSAITSITVAGRSGFLADSSFYLYGIKNS